MVFDSKQLWSLWGVVLSLVFAYFPVVKDWFEQCDPRWKPLIMAGGLFVLTAGKMVVSCNWDWACIQASAGQYAGIWFTALLANIATYNIAVRQVKRVEEERAWIADQERE